MAPDLVQIRELAKEKEDENWRFRGFIKSSGLDPYEIDRQVFETTRRIWAGIDCTAWANCCREVRPTFSKEDVTRSAGRLGVSQQQFIYAYLQRTEGETNQWETRTTPCPFLSGNRCSVYEDRPADCKGYPYLYEPEFAFRTMAMIGRTFTCPIVYEVIEELKQSWGFTRQGRRRRR